MPSVAPWLDSIILIRTCAIPDFMPNCYVVHQGVTIESVR